MVYTFGPHEQEEEEFLQWAGQCLSKTPRQHTPPPVDLKRMQMLVLDHGIASCLYHNLKPTQSALAKQILPDSQRLQLIAVEMLRETEFTKTMEYLSLQLESPPIVFKGQALAYDLYEQPWLRPRSDTDVLIKIEHLAELKKVMLGMEYKEIPTVNESLITYQISMRKKLTNHSYVWDIHWHFSNRTAYQSILNYSSLIQNTRHIFINKHGFLAPNKVHDLLIACLHLIGHHLEKIRLIWLYDIYLLLEALTDVEKEEFIEFAIEHEEVAIAWQTIMIYLDKYLPDARTEKFKQKLSQMDIDQLKNRTYLNRFMKDAQGLTKKDKIRYFRQHIFPSKNYMMERFRLRHHWQLPVWYFIRIIRAIPKLFQLR